LFKYLQLISKVSWSYTVLVSLLRMDLYLHDDLVEWVNTAHWKGRPPPEPKKGRPPFYSLF
jgi:hypothetical protein